jgi:hypothetical protein
MARILSAAKLEAGTELLLASHPKLRRIAAPSKTNEHRCLGMRVVGNCPMHLWGSNPITILFQLEAL